MRLMIRRMHWMLIVVIMASSVPGLASENARRFIAGLEAYRQGDHAEAITQFRTLAESGLVNAMLSYNLGNAYLKNDDLGQAILWYERARRWLPNDPDLRFNLAYARSLTKDVQEADDASLIHIFFFWKYQLSGRTVVILALACNLLFWVLAAGYLLTRRPGLKTTAQVILFPAALFILTAAFNYYEASRVKQAIILPAEVSVRSGLEESSTQLFQLHAGAKVTVLKQLKDHYQIRFSEDKLGWVGRDVAGII